MGGLTRGKTLQQTIFHYSPFPFLPSILILSRYACSTGERVFTWYLRYSARAFSIASSWLTNDDIKIVILHLLRLCFPFYCAMLSGMSEIPTYHFFYEFTFLENIGNMTTYSCSTLIEQLSNLLDIQPDCIAFKPHIEPYTLVRLVDDHFAKITIGSVFPLIATIKA